MHFRCNVVTVSTIQCSVSIRTFFLQKPRFQYRYQFSKKRTCIRNSGRSKMYSITPTHSLLEVMKCIAHRNSNVHNDFVLEVYENTFIQKLFMAYKIPRYRFFRFNKNT